MTMKNTLSKLLLLLVLVPAIVAAADNDIRLQQAAGSSWPTRIFAGESAIGSSAASFRSSIGLGAEDSPTFAGAIFSGLTGLLYGNGGGAVTVATGVEVRTAASLATSTTDNGVPRYDSTAGAQQTSGIVIEDTSANNTTIRGVDANTDVTMRGGTAGAAVKVSRAANGDVELAPSGSGSVAVTSTGMRVGSASSAGQILDSSSTVRFDWSAGGTNIRNSGGSIAIQVPAGTTSTSLIGALIGAVQSLSGAGAVNVTQLSTEYTSTGVSQALTLADGTGGQIKTIVHGVDGGSGILTPTTKTGFTSITFTNAGDTATLQFFATRGWTILAVNGSTITP
jgi:hypothetical protein